MPSTEKTHVQKGGTGNVAIEFSIGESDSIQWRYMEKRLCRFLQIPSEDVATRVTAGNGGMIGRYGE